VHSSHVIPFVHVFSQAKSATPGRQTPEPPLTNEELRAMIQEFMPIGSYDQTESKHTIIYYSSLLIFCKFKQ
jgi:hypothetical protein